MAGDKYSPLDTTFDTGSTTSEIVDNAKKDTRSTEAADPPKKKKFFSNGQKGGVVLLLTSIVILAISLTLGRTKTAGNPATGNAETDPICITMAYGVECNSHITEKEGITSMLPTAAPTTVAPSSKPSGTQTGIPSDKPSNIPSGFPSITPSDMPSTFPSATPTSQPTSGPTADPSSKPSPSPTENPTDAPTEFMTNAPTVSVTYRPGNLTTLAFGLLLSEGLGARQIAISNSTVKYSDGNFSQAEFHILPDGGEAFPDPRPTNLGGWIYTSNSEHPEDGKGGVGAITFDKKGNVLDYKMVLENTQMNCGGGRTPWNTWISCEEIERTGKIYQVDPTGRREPQMLTLGSDGGRWESFAYDIRDRSKPSFFATEDHNKGALRRFIPDNPNWDDPWTMLHGNGTTKYLLLDKTHDGGGTFIWTTNLETAKNNARTFYPQSEGIDVYKNELFFVCKRIYMLFTLDLDNGTYTNQTTVHGKFDGKPDQMNRILDNPKDILYFTEEGSKRAGIHARDATGKYYTVVESPNYRAETTGLAFSPNGKHLYVAYQHVGRLFDIYRLDGLPFYGKRLDVKYHDSRF